MLRKTFAVVDLSKIAHNIRVLQKNMGEGRAAYGCDQSQCLWPWHGAGSKDCPGLRGLLVRRCDGRRGSFLREAAMHIFWCFLRRMSSLTPS